MTVIAFDGHTVAADKQCTTGSLKRTVTKLFVVEEPLTVLALTGDLDHGMELVAWYKSGANSAQFPRRPDRNECCNLTVFQPGKRVIEYENAPIPAIWEDTYYANGGGKYAAMGAMLAGADAVRAVEIASDVTSECGMGWDCVELYGDAAGTRRTLTPSAGATPTS